MTKATETSVVITDNTVEYHVIEHMFAIVLCITLVTIETISCLLNPSKIASPKPSATKTPQTKKRTSSTKSKSTGARKTATPRRAASTRTTKVSSSSTGTRQKSTRSTAQMTKVTPMHTRSRTGIQSQSKEKSKPCAETGSHLTLVESANSKQITPTAGLGFSA